MAPTNADDEEPQNHNNRWAFEAHEHQILCRNRTDYNSIYDTAWQASLVVENQALCTSHTALITRGPRLSIQRTGPLQYPVDADTAMYAEPNASFQLNSPLCSQLQSFYHQVSSHEFNGIFS